MTRKELFLAMRDLGHPSPTPKLLEYSIRIGAVDRPETDHAGYRQYSRRHVEQFGDYLDAPRKRGRPRKTRSA